MQVKDPVCGRAFDLTDAAASEDFEGWAHFFCSVGCHQKFESAPERYSQMPGVAPARMMPGEIG